MSKTTTDPLESLLARIENHPGRSLIALAGMPGSGKSTLAALLCEQVNARLGAGTMAALSMDGFHLTRAHLDAFADPAAAHERRGAPWTFDVVGLAAALGQLKPAYGKRAVAWPQFEHEIGDPTPGPPVFPDTRLILVEGLYLVMNQDGWEEVSSQFDERWYLDTPPDLAMARLSARHRATYGISEAEALVRIARNDGKNAKLVWESRQWADRLIVDEAK